jgi:hypothetical protein
MLNAKSDTLPHYNSEQQSRTLQPEAMRSQEPFGDREPFVDAVQAAGFLSLTPRRVLTLARSGAIPAHPLGNGKRKVWRFRLSELASAVSARRVQSLRQSHVPKGEI